MTLLLLLLLAGADLGGEVISLYATATYEDALGVHEALPAHASVVVINPMLQSQLFAKGVRAVYAPGAVRRWRVSETEWRVWHDPNLPGLREVRIIGSRSVEGIATKGGGLWVCGRETAVPAASESPWALTRPVPLPAVTLFEEVTR